MRENDNWQQHVVMLCASRILTLYSMQEEGRLQEAEEHCMRLLDFGAPNHKERAKVRGLCVRQVPTLPAGVAV